MNRSSPPSEKRSYADGTDQTETVAYRTEDVGPRIFRYDGKSNRRSLWGICGLIAALLAVPVVMAVTKAYDHRWTPGWQWALAAFGLMELMLLLYSLMLLSTARGYLDALRRQNERVIVDRDGLTFEDGVRRVRAVWRDVHGWRRNASIGLWALRGRYMVETAAGDFEFTRCVHAAPVLVALITLRLRREPELVEDDDGLDASVGTDTRKHIYTYRTRTSRALVLLPTFLAIISLIPLFIPLVIPTERPQMHSNIMLQIVLAVCLWSGASVAWVFYFIPRIETDAEGITQRTLCSRKRLEWKEVEAYTLHPEGFDGRGEIVGKNRRLRFGLMIAHIEQLKAEITLQAVHSGTHCWQSPSSAAAISRREPEE